MFGVTRQRWIVKRQEIERWQGNNIQECSTRSNTDRIKHPGARPSYEPSFRCQTTYLLVGALDSELFRPKEGYTPHDGMKEVANSRTVVGQKRQPARPSSGVVIPDVRSFAHMRSRAREGGV